MKRSLIILSILFFIFLMAIPFNTTKAIDNINKATTSAEFKNRINVNPNIEPLFGKLYGKIFNKIETFKDSIEFVDKNLLGIIFFILLVYLLIIRLPYNFFHNHKIIKKYKRENGDNDKKFITQRCKEDGDEDRRHYVYLTNKNDKTYQWLEDDYTIKKLGYGHASRKDNLFSKNDYIIKERIKIYYNIFDIKVILEIFKFKNN